MARRTNKDDLAPVLDAYNQWINRCLIEGGSVFSTQALWTSPIVEEVRRAFVDHPDEGKGDFTTKLKRQMANASPPAKQLMCEMLWALLLFPTNVKADTKREQVRDLWSLSGQQLKEDIPFLSNNVLGGIGSGGTAFNTHRWRELVFLIAIAADLSRKTTPERRQIFSAYDAFMAWMETVPREGKRQFRHMLRFAAFPDRVERMSSNGDRRRILESFGVGSRKEVRLMKDRELDDALLKLRTKLEAQYPGAVLDFYETPLRSRWQPEETSLQGELEGILSEYAQARGKETFGGQSPVFQRFRRIEAAFQETVKKGGEVRTSASPGELPDVNVKASAGAGNWATVPWIAFLDPRETVSTKKGVYCVYLFCEDMSGVYVTLNQGVTEPTQRLGWKDAETFLRDTARDIRARFPQLQNNDFNTSDNIDLHTTGTLGEMYEVSTIAYKFYEAGNIPQDEVLLDDLGHVLATYNQYVDGKSAKRPDSAWVFQANPEYFDIQGALAKLNEMTWVVRQHAESIREGDELFLWESGKDGGVVAVGRIASNPASISQLEQEKSFNLSPDRFDGVQPRVRIRVDRVLPQTIRRSTLLGHPVLESMGILTAPQGSNFKLTPLQAKELRALINGKGMALPSSDLKPLKLIVEEFDAAVSESHLSFGDNHDEILRSFVVSLAAKRFVILTGLSGSGKTQLALRFGEWLGTERFLSLPVRPDWTGAEALFGYEDALQQPLNGRRAWYVPKALEFILSAFHDPHQPYLLLLDEMNLAHVERYFADVLSGMESDYDCLPNLGASADKTDALRTRRLSICSKLPCNRHQRWVASRQTGSGTR